MTKNQSFTISERRFFLRLFDMLVVVGTIFIAASFKGFYYFDLSSERLVTWLITLSIYLISFGQIFEMYDLKNSNDTYRILRSIVLTALSTNILYIFTPYISPELPPNRLQIIFLFLTIALPLLIWRLIYISFIFSPKYFNNLLLIGSTDEVKNLKEFIEDKVPQNRVAGCISSSKQTIDELSCYDLETANIEDVVKELNITEIVVANYNTEVYSKIHSQLIHLFEQGTTIISAKKFKVTETLLLPELKLSDEFYDYITLSKNSNSRLYLILLRLVDIIISIIGLIFLLAIMPLILIGNLLGNRGVLFYNQERVGEKGNFFTIYKLRSMIKNAENDGPVWAEKNDKRITLFGKFLRNTRLDEVPQFYNILKGEMSLIGPRPERPEFVKQLENELPFYVIRHIIKPGLTGWAQVMHPYAANLKDQEMKLRYDLYYIKERNLILDFKIIIKTFTTVLFFRGQ
ncbi:MAG: exopolysaccharide biosynthesis polyprenyl glycosylphosphotransferase [Candidatus Azotimanducaceae bacterium]|jgi:exopolysaccharide biosynthesis polyprenyl glycosylphosphotransferase